VSAPKVVPIPERRGTRPCRLCLNPGRRAASYWCGACTDALRIAVAVLTFQSQQSIRTRRGMTYPSPSLDDRSFVTAKPDLVPGQRSSVPKIVPFLPYLAAESCLASFPHDAAPNCHPRKQNAIKRLNETKMGHSLRRPCPAVEQPRAVGSSDRERASVRDTGIVSADTPVDETGTSEPTAIRRGGEKDRRELAAPATA
jgi:hypothetical protein